MNIEALKALVDLSNNSLMSVILDLVEVTPKEAREAAGFGVTRLLAGGIFLRNFCSVCSVGVSSPFLLVGFTLSWSHRIMLLVYSMVWSDPRKFSLVNDVGERRSLSSFMRPCSRSNLDTFPREIMEAF